MGVGPSLQAAPDDVRESGLTGMVGRSGYACGLFLQSCRRPPEGINKKNSKSGLSEIMSRFEFQIEYAIIADVPSQICVAFASLFLQT